MPVSRRRNPKDCEKIPPAKDRKAENWGADWKAREHTKVCDPTKDGGVPVLLLTSRRRNRQRIVRKYPPAKDYGAEKKGYSEGKREHTTVCDRLSEEECSLFYTSKPNPELQEKNVRHRLTEQKLGAPPGMRGSIRLYVTEQNGRGANKFMPVSRRRNRLRIVR